MFGNRMSSLTEKLLSTAACPCDNTKINLISVHNSRYSCLPDSKPWKNSSSRCLFGSKFSRLSCSSLINLLYWSSATSQSSGILCLAETSFVVTVCKAVQDAVGFSTSPWGGRVERRWWVNFQCRASYYFG